MQQASEADLMTIEVYQDESGLWAWDGYVYEGEPLCGAFGYANEDEAHEAAYAYLNMLS